MSRNVHMMSVQLEMKTNLAKNYSISILTRLFRIFRKAVTLIHLWELLYLMAKDFGKSSLMMAADRCIFFRLEFVSLSECPVQGIPQIKNKSTSLQVDKQTNRLTT